MTERAEVDAADAALVSVLSQPAIDGGAALTIDDVAARVGVGAPVLEALEREGFVVPTEIDGAARYSESDVAILQAGMALLGAGLPLGELLDLGRRFDTATAAVAHDAVDLFVRFVRDPIRGAAESDQQAADQLVEAFDAMLPAAATIVAGHFRRRLIAAALARLA